MPHDRLVGLAGPPAGSDRKPHRLLGLPDQVSLEELPTSSGRHTMVLPVGMGRDGVAAEVRLRAGDHAVIAGPPRSGRTTALQVISTLVRRARPETRQVALCAEDVSSLHGWPSLDASGSPDGLRQVLDAVGADDRRWLVLVDDLRRWGDLEVLAGLAERVDDVTLVVAGRPDDLRGTFGGWLRTVRSSRSGILLQPDLALDGDLLGVRLPRRLSTPLGPGRGFVVDGGDATLAQLAGPPAHPDPGDLAEHDPT